MFSVDDYRWYLPEFDLNREDTQIFWITEESSALYEADSNYIEKILRVFIPDLSVAIFEGTPQTLIFSPQNELLLSHADTIVIPADISFLKEFHQYTQNTIQ